MTTSYVIWWANDTDPVINIFEDRYFAESYAQTRNALEIKTTGKEPLVFDWWWRSEDNHPRPAERQVGSVEPAAWKRRYLTIWWTDKVPYSATIYDNEKLAHGLTEKHSGIILEFTDIELVRGFDYKIKTEDGLPTLMRIIPGVGTWPEAVRRRTW